MTDEAVVTNTLTALDKMGDRYSPRYASMGDRYSPRYVSMGDRYSPRYASMGDRYRYSPRYASMGDRYSPRYASMGDRYSPRYASAPSLFLYLVFVMIYREIQGSSRLVVGTGQQFSNSTLQDLRIIFS